MDIGTVTSIVRAGSRADLAELGPATAVLAGGTWLFSERQDHLSRLVDITTLGWPPLSLTAGGLTVAATCTLAELLRFEQPAAVLSRSCCTALLASEKIWNTATVGGNICLSLPAGAMISLMAGLDAVATVWAADGTDYQIAVADFVTGVGTNVLNEGDVLRSLAIPDASLQSRTVFRKGALAPLGRSGAVVIGRQSRAGAFVLTVTAATTKPIQLRFAALPSAAVVDAGLDQIELWYDDPHGAPDWRRHICGVLAHEILEELA